MNILDWANRLWRNKIRFVAAVSSIECQFQKQIVKRIIVVNLNLKDWLQQDILLYLGLEKKSRDAMLNFILIYFVYQIEKYTFNFFHKKCQKHAYRLILITPHFIPSSAPHFILVSVPRFLLFSAPFQFPLSFLLVIWIQIVLFVFKLSYSN